MTRVKASLEDALEHNFLMDEFLSTIHFPSLSFFPVASIGARPIFKFTAAATPIVVFVDCINLFVLNSHPIVLYIKGTIASVDFKVMAVDILEE